MWQSARILVDNAIKAQMQLHGIDPHLFHHDPRFDDTLLPHLGVLGRLLNRVLCHRPAFPILLLEDGAPDLPGTKLPLEIYSCSLSGPRFKANIG
jgi:hypothetical protein